MASEAYFPRQVEDKMEALVWTAPREMAVQTVPTPQEAPGDLLIRVGATGICGSELSGFLGHSSIRKPPLVMGHETVGVVIRALGQARLADSSAPREGQRVVVNPLVVCGECDRCRAGKSSLCRNRQLLGAHRAGAFAQYIAVPARQCWPLPDAVSDVAGTLTEPVACCVHALKMIGWEGSPAEGSLFIIGAGTIGLCCLAVARSMSVEQVYMSDVAGRRLEVAREWGASGVVNGSERDVLQAIREWQPGGVTAAVDAVGISTTRGQALGAVVPGGTVVLVGLNEESSPFEANYIVRQEVTLRGSFAYNDEDFCLALELISSGVVTPGASWLEERPLSGGPAAFAELVSGTSNATKIVLSLAE